MKEIHKIAAVVIQDKKFLMVRKVGKDVWTSLGGKPENDETEEQALIREIQEEVHCDCKIIRKLGDFKAKAVFDDALLILSAYLVNLQGKIKLDDPELEEYKFISKNYKNEGIKLPDSIEKEILPHCIKEGLLNW